MKKEITRTALAVAGITLLSPFFFGVNDGKDYVEAIAITSFFTALLALFIGLVLLIPAAVRRYGQALLLCCAVLMLMSFTLCSSGIVKLNI